MRCVDIAAKQNRHPKLSTGTGLLFAGGGTENQNSLPTSVTSGKVDVVRLICLTGASR
ncbi:hypothetical protein SH449x_005160 [Pirellulaceae bacterium SH449]